MDLGPPIIGTKTTKPQVARIKRGPPKIDYDIGSDILDRKANISVRDFIKISPTMRRELSKECRPKRNTPTMALIEDEELDTTAAYTTLCIGDKKIRALIECGAAKTCMSKALADVLDLSIDASSDSIFTLGNSAKQPALGIIYDAPMEAHKDIIIPCTVEVLPSCPAHLIIGNNWLLRAKAKIDFNTSTLQISYKHQETELGITFTQKKDNIPKLRSQIVEYKKPVSATNSKTRHVRFEETTSEHETGKDYDASESSEGEDSQKESKETEGEEELLLVLEDDQRQEIEVIQQKEESSIRSTSKGLKIPANASTIFIIHNERIEQQHQKEYIYNFELTNPKLMKAQGIFDQNSKVIVNRKSIEIHLYHRTTNEIFIKPCEDIGILEKLNLRTEEVVQVHEMNREQNFFVLQESEPAKEEPMKDELYNKLEIGDIHSNLGIQLKSLINKYQNLFHSLRRKAFCNFRILHKNSKFQNKRHTPLSFQF